MYRGWAGGRGVGRVAAKKIEKLSRLGGCPIARPKREESTIDRMAILPMAAVPTKKHGTLVRPRNHPPSSHSRR